RFARRPAAVPATLLCGAVRSRAYHPRDSRAAARRRRPPAPRGLWRGGDRGEEERVRPQAEKVIASEAKQSRTPCGPWIASSAYGLLAMTARQYASLLRP